MTSDKDSPRERSPMTWAVVAGVTAAAVGLVDAFVAGASLEAMSLSAGLWAVGTWCGLGLGGVAWVIATRVWPGVDGPSGPNRRIRGAATLLGGGVFVASCWATALWLATRFRDPDLMSVVETASGLLYATVIVGVSVPCVRALERRRGGRPPAEWTHFVPLAVRRHARVLLAIVALPSLWATGHVAWRGLDEPQGVLMEAARRGLDLASDWDGDGVGLVASPPDCAPLDPKIHPGARDRRGNGIDEDCSGTDRPRRSK